MRSDSSLPDRIDRYEVDALLGLGAFAAVYRAIDPALDHPVAIKVLGDHHSADPDIRARFVREARLLRRLGEGADGRLVTVHDIGEWRHQPFIVMDAFDDGTLADWLGEHAPLQPDSPELHWLINEVAACLGVVHAGGVTHRDVKPSNFLLRRATQQGADDVADSLVLADFGLARDADASRLTVAGGTEHYMAPEQRNPSADVDARADVHAASVLVADAIDGAAGDLGERLRRGRAADPDDRPADIGQWQVELLDAIEAPAQPGRPKRARWLRRIGTRRQRVVAALCALLVVVAVAALTLTATPEPSTPTVEGPAELVLGEIGVYRHDDREGADYRWEDAGGRTLGEDGADSVEIKPVDTGVYELTLIETLDGEERTAVFEIDVVAP